MPDRTLSPSRHPLRVLPPARSALLVAALLSLAVGCGAQDETGTPDPTGDAVEETTTEGTPTGTDDPEDAPASDGGGVSAEDPAASTLPPTVDLAADPLPVTAEDAISVAGTTVGDGDLVSIGIDGDEDGGWVWELEIERDGIEHDLEIDATTSAVLTHEQEEDQDRDPVVDPASPLAIADALDLALAEREGRVSGWDLDAEDDVVRYSVDIEPADGGDQDDLEVVVEVDDREVRVEG